MKFKVGEIVEHVLSKDWLLILLHEEASNRYLCRMKNHHIDWFYEFELINKKTY